MLIAWLETIKTVSDFVFSLVNQDLSRGILKLISYVKQF